MTLIRKSDFVVPEVDKAYRGTFDPKVGMAGPGTGAGSGKFEEGVDPRGYNPATGMIHAPGQAPRQPTEAEHIKMGHMTDNQLNSTMQQMRDSRIRLPQQGQQLQQTAEKAMREKIIGGLGDNKPDSGFDPKCLAHGIEVEKEHTKDKKVAKEIAKDHLTEDPKYYKKLKKMEAKKSLAAINFMLKAFPPNKPSIPTSTAGKRHLSEHKSDTFDEMRPVSYEHVREPVKMDKKSREKAAADLPSAEVKAPSTTPPAGDKPSLISSQLTPMPDTKPKTTSMAKPSSSSGPQLSFKPTGAGGPQLSSTPMSSAGMASTGTRPMTATSSPAMQSTSAVPSNIRTLGGMGSQFEPRPPVGTTPSSPAAGSIAGKPGAAPGTGPVVGQRNPNVPIESESPKHMAAPSAGPAAAPGAAPAQKQWTAAGTGAFAPGQSLVPQMTGTTGGPGSEHPGQTASAGGGGGGGGKTRQSSGAKQRMKKVPGSAFGEGMGIGGAAASDISSPAGGVAPISTAMQTLGSKADVRSWRAAPVVPMQPGESPSSAGRAGVWRTPSLKLSIRSGDPALFLRKGI